MKMKRYILPLLAIALVSCKQAEEKQTEAPRSSGGCGGFIGAGAIAVVALVAACGAVAFKKREN